MLTQVTTCDNFPQSRILVDALAGVNMPAEAIAIDWLIDWLDWWTIVLMTGELIRFGVDMFTAVCIMVVFIVATILENVAPVLCTIDARTGAMIDVLLVTDFIGIGSDVVAGVDANIRVATTTSFEFIPMLAWSNKPLLFDSRA